MPGTVQPNIGLTQGYDDLEDGWGAALNAGLRALDALVQARVVDKDLSAPPGAPTTGDLYIVGASPTGAWAGQAGKLARYKAADSTAAGWEFYTAKSGWRVYVVDEAATYVFNGTAWALATGSKFATNIGDGVALNYVVTHNLGTRDVHVTIYRNAAPFDEPILDVEHTDANSVTIKFTGTAPAANAFRVVVS